MLRSRTTMRMYHVGSTLWAITASILLFLLSFSGVLASVDDGGTMTASRILAEINRERISLGLGVLKVNAQLQSAAESKAQDMVARGYFSHNDPQGNAPWLWIESSGYRYEYAGENLAIGFNKVETQHRAWMESRFHRRNILNSKYTETGIAILKGRIRGVDEFVVVQFFGTPTVGSVAKSAPIALPHVQGVADTNQEIVRNFGYPEVGSNQGNVAAVNGFARVVYDLVLQAAMATQLWRTAAVVVLVIQFCISMAVALKIYARIYRRTRTVDLGGVMM